MRSKQAWLSLGILMAALVATGADAKGLFTIETGYTITKVRTGTSGEVPFIVASSYEGSVLGITFDGSVRWTNPLSGTMNRDLLCVDLNGDDIDEVLAANADGNLYCLSVAGELLWKFKANDAPMNAVCVVNHNGDPYVVCGGYDKNIYYLTAAGKLVKTIASSTYSKEKSWGKSTEKRIPPKFLHVANFMRAVRGPGGKETLAVHGALNSNSGRGSLYLFHPMDDKPFAHIAPMSDGPFGDFGTSDFNQDGVDEILLGSSGMIDDAVTVRIDLNSETQHVFAVNDLARKIDRFGYRVTQAAHIGDSGTDEYLILFGSCVFLVGGDLETENAVTLRCRYSFNDLWKDAETGKIILASVQSGGSGIHVLDPSDPQWKQAYVDFEPSGTIAKVLANTQETRRQLETFLRPEWEPAPRPIYFMTESLDGEVGKFASLLQEEYKSPVFLSGKHMPMVENWDRSEFQGEEYRDKRDRRKKYSLESDEALKMLTAFYGDHVGIAFWGGHGNDPMMFSKDTLTKLVDFAKGKKTVLIYPELEHYGDGFDQVLTHYFYPLAEHFRGKNANLYVRTKHAFWQSIVYLPLWSRLLSGEFADVFVPSMEETTDKTMEQSLAGRMGIWASGAVDNWGTRCARDNASFDRLRQHSHQMVPNHFLRTQVYHIASGATFINNFPVDQEYMKVLWELIAKGALYVPRRNEIVSFSPVHVSMTEPDELYLDEGNNAKWLTFYDKEFDEQNPMVFSRLNGTWPGAPVTDWDFSRYAAGVKDRRLNFLPPFHNGLVLITPPQNGVFADDRAPRGKLKDNLHPLYRNILREVITDGRQYLSPDGKQSYPADNAYQAIESEIKQRSKLLPLTVSGDVAWVTAQTSPTHLRLTLIDSGYINPKRRTATIHFHTVTPTKMVDVLGKEVFDVKDPASVTVDVPCGLFRFIDIELRDPLER